MELVLVLVFFIFIFFLFKKETQKTDRIILEMMKSYSKDASQQIFNDFYRDTQETTNLIKKDIKEIKQLLIQSENALEEVNLMLMGVPIQKQPPKNPNFKVIKITKKKEDKDDEPTKQ